MKNWQKVLLIVLGVILALVCIFIVVFKYVVVPKATDVVIEKAVEAVVGEPEVVDVILDNIEEEDKQFVEDIIMEYVTDPEAMTQVLDYVNSNDYTGLKDYAVGNLTEEQMEQAFEIAEKYKDVLPPEAQEILELYK